MSKHDGDSRQLALGIAATIAAGFALSGMDALGKSLMTTQGFVQVVWARYLFHALLTGAWLVVSVDAGRLVPRRPALQLLRSACLVLITLSMYAAIRVVPLADASAVMFFAPVLVTALAGLVLGEAVGWRRYTAVAVGFCGVLLIVRPGFAAFEPAILLACLAALGYAAYVLLTRKLQSIDSEHATLLMTTTPGALALTLVVPFFWEPVAGLQWPLLMLTGLLGAIGHFLLIKAFSAAPASTLSPFLNAQLVAAAIYSVVFFNDRLEPAFYAGATLVVGSGLFIWWRERQLARRALRRTVPRA